MSAADIRASILRPDVIWAFQRFPLSMLAAGLMTLWLLLHEFARIYIQEVITLPWDRVVFMLTLAFLAATVASFATLRMHPWLSTFVQVLAYFSGLGLGFVAEITSHTTVPLILSFMCFISLAAGFAAGGGMIGFWLTNISLTANLVLCLVSLAIVLSGGGIILYSIEALLGFDSNKAFTILSSVAFAFGTPLLWLSLSRFCEEPAGEQPVNLLHRVISVVTDGLLIPLMLIFAAVLHVYAGRIALMVELPKGQIGWIVPTYLAVGYGVYLLAHSPSPLLSRLRRFFLCSWLLSTLVPLVLLAIAIAMRIDAYGITEDRYLLTLIVVGGTLVIVSALIRRPLDLRVLPLVAGALALIAAIGPLSAPNVTLLSQTARAKAILASVPPERWATVKDGGLSKDQKRSLHAAVEYLYRQDPNLEILASVWPVQLPKTSWELEKELAIEEPIRSFGLVKSDVIELETITILNGVYLGFDGRDFRIVEGKASTFRLSLKGHILEVASEASTTRFDLSHLPKAQNDLQNLDPVLHSMEGRKGDLILSQFEWASTSSGLALKKLSATFVLY